MTTNESAAGRNGTGPTAGTNERHQPNHDARDSQAGFVMPHAVGPEKSVVSAVLQYPERLPEVADLTAEHFHLPTTRITLTAAREMAAAGKVPELVGLIQHMMANGRIDCAGGPSAVTDLHGYDASGGRYLATHSAILREYHARRQAIALTDEIRAAALERTEDKEPLLEALTKAAALLDTAKRGTTRQGFPVAHHSEIFETADPLDFVERLLTGAGASVVYGPSNSGKSFWVIDLAACVATSRPFRDELEVDQGAVVYVALEGGAGLRNRILAMRRAGRLPDSAPFYLLTVGLNLLEPGHAEKLAATVKAVADQAAMPCRLVVMDTLARAMAGGDENSGRDMGEAVKRIDLVRAATGAHVLTVHHCGKDEAKGARGHSSLRAAVDTEIEVFRPDGENVSTVRVTKQRDLSLGEPMPFTLEVVELGTDRRGKPITSCVVRHEDAIMAATRGKAGRAPLCTPDGMLRFLPAASVKEWQATVKEETGLDRTQFYAHKKTLEHAGKVRKETGTNRLVAV